MMQSRWRYSLRTLMIATSLCGAAIGIMVQLSRSDIVAVVHDVAGTKFTFINADWWDLRSLGDHAYTVRVTVTDKFGTQQTKPCGYALYGSPFDRLAVVRDEVDEISAVYFMHPMPEFKPALVLCYFARERRCVTQSDDSRFSMLTSAQRTRLERLIAKVATP
jgi:hypothetical protein